MTTEADLRNAVTADPQGYGARMVLADWLEERGQPELAEFHRLVATRKLAPRLEPDRRTWRGSYWQVDRVNPNRGERGWAEWWEWWCNPGAVLTLSPVWFVSEERMARMGPTYRIGHKGGRLLVKRFRQRSKALAALEAVWAAPGEES